MNHMFSVSVLILSTILFASSGTCAEDSGDNRSLPHFTKSERGGMKAFVYETKVLLGQDGGVIGAHVELSNTSETNALTMRGSGDGIPVGIVLHDMEGKQLVGVATVPGTERFSTKSSVVRGDESPRREITWVIPPSSSQKVFIPLRRLFQMPEGTDRLERCYLIVMINVFPSWFDRNAPEHPYTELGFTNLTLTKKALESDSAAQLKIAEAAPVEKK